MQKPSSLSDVRAAMVTVANRIGRKPGETELIAISKTYSAEEIRPLIAAGQRHFGENRVQEAQEKWPALKAETPGLVLHMVGQLQSNKADEAIALFDVIHCVDRLSLVTALAKAMVKTGRNLPCFIQVNIGDEAQKGGCPISETAALLEQARTAGLNIVGLMAVPPAGIEAAPFFALLHKMARELGLDQLSIGMSGDFETAIMMGATHIRVGSAVFGPRA